MENQTTILVIDDEPAIRIGLAATLGRRGYAVITAMNGDDGYLKAKQSPPDLIISDVMMPDLDGYGVLYLLGKNASTAGIPFIFLTAKAEKSDLRKGMSMGLLL